MHKENPVLRLNIRNIPHLLDLVGASGPNPSYRGPKVVEATLWDGRKVSASYYKGPKETNPDARSRFDIFYDVEPLRPLVKHLLESGESFVTDTGSDDMVCTLEWSMTPATTTVEP